MARSVVITAGFHGDEKAGPLTLAGTCCRDRRLRGRARRRAAIYPCVNPSRFRGAHPLQRHRRAPQQRLSALRDHARVLARRAARRRAVPARRPAPTTGSPRRPRRWRASWTRCRRPTRRWTCTRTTSSTASLFYAYIFGDRRRLPAAAGAVGRADARPAQQPSSTPGTSRAPTSTPTRRGSSSATTAASPTAFTAPASPTRRRSRPRPRPPGPWPTRST